MSLWSAGKTYGHESGRERDTTSACFGANRRTSQRSTGDTSCRHRSVFYEDRGRKRGTAIQDRTAFIPDAKTRLITSPTISIGGQSADLSLFRRIWNLRRGVNHQRATGTAFVTVELDREFQWPGSRILRTIEVDSWLPAVPAMVACMSRTAKRQGVGAVGGQ